MRVHYARVQLGVICWGVRVMATKRGHPLQWTLTHGLLVQGEPFGASTVAACGEATKPGLTPNGSLNQQSPKRGEGSKGRSDAVSSKLRYVRLEIRSNGTEPSQL